MLPTTRNTSSTINWAWSALGLILVAFLVTPPRTVGDSLGARRFLTPEVGEEFRVGQRFTMDGSGLSGIEIRAVAVGPVTGNLLLKVRGMHTGTEVSADVPAADLVRAESYTFRFPPIERSADFDFQLDITASPGNAGRGIALWATKGARLDRGGLLINGTPRWASLAFQTHTPAVAPIRAMFGTREANRPPRWLAGVGLLGVWVALRFVLKALVTSADDIVLAR